MRKKVMVSVLILVLGCVAGGLILGCSKEKAENTAMEADIEMCVNAWIQAGDGRSREEIAEEIRKDFEENEKREKEDYLKALEEGIVVTDEEIEAAIQESKEAVEGTDAEAVIEEYCEGEGITIDEYWESPKLKDIYRRNYLIAKYRRSCQE